LRRLDEGIQYLGRRDHKINGLARSTTLGRPAQRVVGDRVTEAPPLNGTPEVAPQQGTDVNNVAQHIGHNPIGVLLGRWADGLMHLCVSSGHFINQTSPPICREITLGQVMARL
jgi:hypothetical protein